MKYSKSLLLILAIVFQLTIVLGLALYKQLIVSGGTEIVLQVWPVDPRDPLRGDYVTFDNALTYIEKTSIDPSLEIERGMVLYVPVDVLSSYGYVNWWELQRDGMYVSNKPPKDRLYIKGTITDTDAFAFGGPGRPVFEPVIEGTTSTPAREIQMYENVSSIRVSYGIEEYFIPEGTGQNVDFMGRDAKAIVVVDEDGNAVLKQIFIDGEPWP